MGDVRVQLAEITGTKAEDWFLFFRARHGMEAVFNALREHRGEGSVVTQAYTCITAVNPIVAAGLKPVYADVSADSVSISEVNYPEDAKAIVLQHTFGIIDDKNVSRIISDAKKQHILTVEDSAHCVGSMARDENGPLADVSIHSFGGEKLLPTNFGGAIWLNPALDQELRAGMINNFEKADALPFSGRFAARTYRDQVRLFARVPLYRPIRNLLTRLGFFLPPIAQCERRGKNDLSPKLPSKWVRSSMDKALNDYDRYFDMRVKACAVYLRKLKGKIEIPALVDGTQPLVRMPLYVPQERGAEDLFSAVRAAGFYPGRWYRPALFPGPDNPKIYNLDPELSDLPVTKDLVSRALNLPTDVNEAQAEKIADVVLEWL